MSYTPAPGAPVPTGSEPPRPPEDVPYRGGKRIGCGAAILFIGSVGGALLLLISKNPPRTVLASIVWCVVGGALIWWGRRAQARQPRAGQAPVGQPQVGRTPVPGGAGAQAARLARRAQQEEARRAAQAARAARKAERQAQRRVAAEQRERERREREDARRRERELHGYMAGSEWVPPLPLGRRVEPWVRGLPMEVVGEAYRGDAIRRAYARAGHRLTPAGEEFTTRALLVPDPGNPYGHGRAVAVYVEDQHVGYLAQADADRYHPVLSGLRDDGDVVEVPARVWAREDGTRVRARVTITVPDPDGVPVPPGLPDQPYAVIPTGQAVQVTREEHHMDVLADYAPGGTGERPVAAVLREVAEPRGRRTYQAVQVELDGRRVGVLTPGQSAKMLPLVRHVQETGRIPVAHAVVRGTRLKADVVLRTQTAETVSNDWLDSLGGHARG